MWFLVKGVVMSDSKSAPVHPLEIGLPGEKDIYGI